MEEKHVRTRTCSIGNIGNIAKRIGPEDPIADYLSHCTPSAGEYLI